MFATVKPDRRWGEIGLKALIWSAIAAVVLALLDGVMKGPMQSALTHDYSRDSIAGFVMFSTWVVDFRYLAEQAVLAAAIFFVGAKFFETRSVLTIGFDRLDADTISLKGPGEDNIVWIGHRYATPVEAQSVANAFAERLKQSAA